MSTTDELRVGVVGAGMMGTDHIVRITNRITGATVTSVVEPDADRAEAAAALVPWAQTFTHIEDALAANALDAVLIATPGRFHESVLLPAIEAGLPILCEKPLSQDAESSWRILCAEQTGGAQLIQVGFMRRFDPEYKQLRELIATRTAGDLLLLHGTHRNPAVPTGYTQEMLITDSVVHEFDIMPWLADSSIRTIEVRYAKRNSLSPARLREPILVLMELHNNVLIDVEMNVSAQFGYQVATEAVFERGVARIGQPSGLRLWQDSHLEIAEHESFITRFAKAYDLEVQAWVDAARQRTIAGPSAWEGYKVAVACAAGVKALSTHEAIALDLPESPAFYTTAPTTV